VAGWKPLDEAAMLRSYEMIKKTDPAGAEKMVASMRESAAESKRQHEVVAPRTTAALEKQVADLQKYRASFSAAELASAAVNGDPTGELKRKLDADLNALRALTPADQKQVDEWGREGRAMERQAQVEASTNKNAAEAARLRAQANALGLKARALRDAHMERVSPLITDALAQHDLASLKPGDRDRALAMKPDPAFPNYADPNRIQMITVMFSQVDTDPKQAARRAWQEKTKETFDFATLAGLIR
jgi:hypothetical protein